MRNKLLLLPCLLLLIGCSSSQPWSKPAGAGTQSSQDSTALRKALGDCLATAAEAHEMYQDDLDELFGRNSTHAYFQKCMGGKGYVKG